MKTQTTVSKEQARTIYFAGGCFWGTEKYFATIPGVIDAEAGYAQGNVDKAPTYEEVCSGKTGCRETVKITFDPNTVSVDALVLAFFQIINPTVTGRQGNDIGDQYQTGIYYTDAAEQSRVEKIVAIEKTLHKNFAVEVEKLTSYYPAETYHQDYLDKNPLGYCHITPGAFKKLETILKQAEDDGISVDAALKNAFAPEAYKVTQQNATERPFTSAYGTEDRKGIYVDITTGEPLFSSEDKYTSSCGWPAFTRSIADEAIAKKQDTSHGMTRTEVRSSQGDAHLGHVFTVDSESPNGVRFCINGAALRFVPFEDLEKEGYEEYRELFDKK